MFQVLSSFWFKFLVKAKSYSDRGDGEEGPWRGVGGKETLLGKANPDRNSFPSLGPQRLRKAKFKAKSLFTLNLQ